MRRKSRTKMENEQPIKKYRGDYLLKQRRSHSTINKIPNRKKPKKEENLLQIQTQYPNQEIHLVVEFPPSMNHMYFTAKNGSRILKKDAQKYLEQIKLYCREQIKKQKWKKEGEGIWYVMDLYFYMPDKRKRDTHNCLKILLDALEHEIYVDDYFVMPRIQDVKLDKLNPRVEIKIYPKEDK